jgi:hypothetical protein
MERGARLDRIQVDIVIGGGIVNIGHEHDKTFPYLTSYNDHSDE